MSLGVVLVRRAGGVFLAVGEEGEIAAHHRMAEAWTQQDVLVFRIILVQPFEQMKKMLADAGRGTLQEEGVNSDLHFSMGTAVIHTLYARFPFSRT